MASTNIVKYSGFSAADAAEVAEEAAKGSTGGFFTPKEGKNILRILPGRQGQKTILNVPQHWVKLAGMEEGKSVNCASLIESKPCLVCEYMSRISQTGNAADFKIAEGLKPRRRNFAAVILRTDEGRGALIWGFGKLVLDDLVELQGDYGDFTNPNEGYDICVRRKGTGLDSKYKVTKDVEGPLSDDADMLNQMLEALPNLESLREVPTREDIIEMCGDAMVATARPRGVHTKAKPAAALPTGRRAPVTASVEDDLDQSEDDQIPFG